MTERRVLPLIVGFLAGVLVGLVLVFAVLGVAAYADTAPTIPPYVKPPYVCGPTQMPSQVPCDQLPTTTTTTVAFKYCLGYPQQFPHDQPCPRPPDTSCQGSARPVDCDPTYNPTPPVAPEPGGTVATTAPAPAVEPTTAPAVDDTAPPVSVQHRATQRRSGPPRRRVVSTTTTTEAPQLYFVLGQWLTYDEFVALIAVMGP